MPARKYRPEEPKVEPRRSPLPVWVVIVIVVVCGAIGYFMAGLGGV